MIIRWFDPLLLLLCNVFLRGQLFCGGCGCCDKCPSHAPSPTIATCSCSTTTQLQSTESSYPATTKESPFTTNDLPISSSLVSNCPTLGTTDCSKCLATSPSVTTEGCPKCPEKPEQNSSLSTERQVPSSGAVIGAALGGAVIGSILTVIVFVCIRRGSHSTDDNKEELKLNIVRNGAYQYNNEQIDSVDSASRNSTYSEIHNNETRKAARISPVMRQENTIEKEGVYNHLHETKKEDRSDYYDHAGPAPSLSVMEDGYGVLSVESGGNGNYNTVDGNYSTDRGESITAENKQSDDYFILESQNK